MAVSDLQFGPGSTLWRYWTAGEGLAKWSGAVHKWTTLRDLLLKAGVPAHSADGLATNIIMAVMPGYMQLAHAKGRSGMGGGGQFTSGSGGSGASSSKPAARPAAKPKAAARAAPVHKATAHKAGRSAMTVAGRAGVAYADPKNGKYPIDTAAHAQSSCDDIGMPQNAAQYPLNGVTLAEVQARIMAACKKFGISDDDGDEANAAHFAAAIDVVRSGGGMELQPADDGSLGTLTGRFSEFGRWYPVSSRVEGNFLERAQPGATIDTIRDDRDAMRVLFDHGMDGQIGNKVLGPIGTLEERSDGPWYEVPLFDTSYNRDLLPGLKAGVYGASMRMRVLADSWDDDPARSESNPDGLPERTITRMKVLEFGPVTFPANPGASAGVRSGTDEFYYRLAQVNAPAFEDAARACGLSFEDFTGRVTARSGPGRERGVRPGNGAASPANQTALRDRAWRMRRMI